MCDWLCYLIQSDNRTYVGITNNLARRLRQHNGAIKGGAKATRGRRWALLCTVGGFPSVTAVKQFEWRMHHPPRRASGLAGRLRSLEAVLALPRWTKSAPLSADLALIVRWHCAPNALPYAPQLPSWCQSVVVPAPSAGDTESTTSISPEPL